MSRVRACGKVILLGEHSVVYGRPALAAGIDRGVEAEFRAEPVPRGDAPVALRVAPWNVDFTPGDETEVGRALAAMLAALPAVPADAPRGTVHASILLPGSGGLGSSAALGVATARALSAGLLGHALGHDETLAAALAWERVFHGNPSGVDHTVAALGGAGTFTRSEGFRQVRLRAPLRLLVADTGERTPTRETVAQVARQHARRPEATEKIFDAIAALVQNAVLALGAGDLRALGQLMDLNQALLASLMLSTERTEELCRAARDAGAFGAKLTGGGGGGCVLALPGAREEAVREALVAVGAATFVAEIGGVAAEAR
jgi:mevalonate kinase